MIVIAITMLRNEPKRKNTSCYHHSGITKAILIRILIVFCKSQSLINISFTIIIHIITHLILIRINARQIVITIPILYHIIKWSNASRDTDIVISKSIPICIPKEQLPI